jgi:hypothetical protein
MAIKIKRKTKKSNRTQSVATNPPPEQATNGRKSPIEMQFSPFLEQLETNKNVIWAKN